MEDERPVDIVLFGATSLTGGFAIEYLLQHPEKPSFAIAGRSQTKLSLLRTKYHIPATVPTIVADSFDKPAIAYMVQRGKVIVNLAGPYNLFNARGIIAECVHQGKSYTDLTGESGFYLKVLNEFHEKAKDAGSKILPSAGLDCVPFDLTTFLAVQHLKSLTPAAVITNVTTSFEIIASISKGTITSGADMATEPGSKWWQMRNVRPHLLSPLRGKQKMPWGPVMPAPGFGRGKTMAWTPISPHNHRVVNRTWGLLETEGTSSKEKYGEHFQWMDGMITSNFIFSCFLSVILKLGITLMILIPRIGWLTHKLPDHWTTATDWSRQNAFLDLRTVAESQAGEKTMCRMYIRGDPAYHKTSHMLIEAALTLLSKDSKLHPIAERGGVLTTALLGPTYPERLVKYSDFMIHTESLTGADEDVRKR